MGRLFALFRSSIGRKLLMAGTGLGLLGFVVAHLLGNLNLYQGPEALNAYAAWIKGMPMALWAARAGLLAIFVLHVALGISLARENRAARPERYRRGLAMPAANWPARTMALSGLVVLGFVVFHLLHFTFGVIEAEHYDPKDVYAMVVASFRNPWIVAFYAVTLTILLAHLVHGTVSSFQTLGVNHENTNRAIRLGGRALAVVLVVGYVSMPVLVYLGVVG